MRDYHKEHLAKLQAEIDQLKAQLAEAKRAWEVADDERVAARAQLKAGKKYMSELQTMFDRAVAYNHQLRVALEQAVAAGGRGKRGGGVTKKLKLYPGLKKPKKTRRAVERFWQAFFMSDSHDCVLCGNRGLIDTTSTAVTNCGLRVGRRGCCICPNGMAIRFQDE